MSSHCADWPRSSFAFWVAAALTCLGSSGCGDDSYRLGGEVRQGSVQSNSSRPSSCTRAGALEFIDQMEDGIGPIDFTAERSGHWFAFNDQTGGSQYPEMNLSGTFPMTKLDPPRAGSRYAAHTYGSGFTRWGSGIGFDLRAQSPYDASSYAGFSFWARRAPGSPAEVRFNVPERRTSALGDVCQGDFCSDDFGQDLELDTSFRYFSFTWAELKQEGWSNQVFPDIDVTQIYGLRFQTGRDVDFDFWIDDVAFICR